MSSKRYIQGGLEEILRGFERGISIDELANKLGRPPYGLALKMVSLSENNPSKWDPEEIRKYTHREIRKHKGDIKGQKMRWRSRHRMGKTTKYRTNPQEIDLSKVRNYLTELLDRYSTKKAFAEEIGIHPSLLSHYLAGKRVPSHLFMRRLSEIAGIPYRKFEGYFKPEL